MQTHNICSYDNQLLKVVSKMVFSVVIPNVDSYTYLEDELSKLLSGLHDLPHNGRQPISAREQVEGYVFLMRSLTQIDTSACVVEGDNNDSFVVRKAN